MYSRCDPLHNKDAPTDLPILTVIQDGFSHSGCGVYVIRHNIHHNFLSDIEWADIAHNEQVRAWFIQSQVKNQFSLLAIKLQMRSII